MFTDNLYQTALIEPPRSGADELFAIVGYGSATFANRHLKEKNLGFKLNLIVGMPDGRSDYLAFQNLSRLFPDRFRGFYVSGYPAVHCKAYGWFQDGIPFSGYTGSANYSNNAFGNSQTNQLISTDPQPVKKLFNYLLDRCVPIDSYVPSNVVVPSPATNDLGSAVPGGIVWESPGKRVRISFLDRAGVLPVRSGLNWGQRPDREPNQAYLSLKGGSRDEGFLPPLAETFSLITDDEKSIDCVTAQQGRKAIQSTLNNSELGVYFRNRLGVPLGKPVLVEHLQNYGRTDFVLEKINEETFLLDFSV